MSDKFKTILITILFLGLLIGLFVYAFLTSDFSNLKKAENGMDSDLKNKIAKKRYYNTDVEIQANDMVNLGDFEINIGDGQKLITNISLKYDKPKGWGVGSGVDDELMLKGSILRHATIEAIRNQKETDVKSYKVKEAIMNNINPSLSTTSVENVYFNRLIIAD
jgi:flagellar basal body-associated protein FliL